MKKIAAFLIATLLPLAAHAQIQHINGSPVSEEQLADMIREYKIDITTRATQQLLDTGQVTQERADFIYKAANDIQISKVAVESATEKENGDYLMVVDYDFDYRSQPDDRPLMRHEFTLTPVGERYLISEMREAKR